MAEMRIEHPHPFTQEEAKQRLQALGEYLGAKHGISVIWDGDKAAFTGKVLVVNIRGSLSFTPGKALFVGDDPGFLFRSKAKDYIGHKLGVYLDPAKKREELPRK